METKVCKVCGQELPVNAFRMTRWGTNYADLLKYNNK